MIVLAAVRGRHHFYKELAQRYAEAGIDAVTIDYLGRTAGIDERDDSFGDTAHVQKTTPEASAADAGAAMAYLKSKDGGAVKSVFTVGFCFGGSNSFNQSAFHPDLNGCIGFYGRPIRNEAFISKMKAPLLVMIAGADAATPLPQAKELVHKLEAAAVPVASHLHDGAPHSSFDRGYEQWKEACDDA